MFVPVLTLCIRLTGLFQNIILVLKPKRKNWKVFPQIWADTGDILLMYIDIDQLRVINEEYGRAAGDEMVVISARCVENVFQEKGPATASAGMNLRFWSMIRKYRTNSGRNA